MNVNVGGGVSVLVEVAVAGGTCVNVGNAVLTPPDGWKGVDVGDAFGSCVMRMNGANDCGVGVGEAQAERSVMSNA